jgi:putative ABC transport system permease protein
VLSAVWIAGLFKRRTLRLAGSFIGVALAVALLVAVGKFIVSSAATMSARAASGVAVDWQVALQPGADAAAVDAALRSLARATAVEQVGYAPINALSATTGASTQTTGAGFALGIRPTYASTFPRGIRLLAGSLDGVLLAQQTASNLHAGVGDRVTIVPRRGTPRAVIVRGVVDLPAADSLFAPINAQHAALQAPPDNVILLPLPLWETIAGRSGSRQLHARLAHDLPGDPAAAYREVRARANAVEARLAGAVMVGDNLAARLLGVIADAAYARLLFLFLGLPGAMLMALLTIAVASSGEARRRIEQSLLRIRGASTSSIVTLAAIEACVVGLAGAVSGVALGWFIAPTGEAGGWNASSSIVAIIAGGLGLLLAAYAIVVPAWRQARDDTPAAAGRLVQRAPAKPLWQTLYLDVVLLLVAGVTFWRAAASGYEIVVAPEGVPQAAISYGAFIAPLCLWLGSALLLYRLLDMGLARPNRALRELVKPLGHELATTVAAFVSRQRELVERGAVLAALGFGFAVSTAVFNVTYNAQARVDAELTNGADVTVTGTPADPPDRLLPTFEKVPGVVAAAPMQHRYAYVGNDLQDLYGIDPHRIAAATAMSNAYFESKNARATLDALAQRPDGVLVSRETVNDFRLNPGDRLNLRLQSARDHRYHAVPFTFIGVVREFPTAPRGTFRGAPAWYHAQMSGSPGAEIVLLRTSGDPQAVAARVAQAAAGLKGVHVSDISQAQRLISSSLTAVDLRGLTALELLFAVLGIAGATGIVLALGFGERRRSFVVLWALGAKPKQLASFWWSEALLMVGSGALAGSVIGFALAIVLVKLLTGVFDPPPQSLAIPVGSLVLFALSALASTIAAVLAAQLAMRKPSPADLREL